MTPNNAVPVEIVIDGFACGIPTSHKIVLKKVRELVEKASSRASEEVPAKYKENCDAYKISMKSVSRYEVDKVNHQFVYKVILECSPKNIHNLLKMKCVSLFEDCFGVYRYRGTIDKSKFKEFRKRDLFS